MSDSQGTLATVAEHLALALAPLQDAVANLDSFRAFLFRLGWEAESIPPSYVHLADLAAEALAAVDGLGDRADEAAVAAALDRSRAVFLALRQLDEAPAGVDPTEFLAELADRLFEILLVDYLAAAVPTAYTLLRLLHIIQLEDHEQTATRPAYVRTRFAADEIPRVVEDPAAIPARVYGWGTPDLDFPLVANHLLDLVHALGLPASLDRVDPVLAAALQRPPEQTQGPMSLMLRIPVFELDVEGAAVDVALALLELPAEDGHLPGLVLQPLVPPQAGTGVDLGDGLSLGVRAGSDLASTFGVVVRPGEIDVRYPFEPGTQLPSAGFGVSLVFAPPSPKLLLGEPAGTRLQLAGTSLALEIDTHAGQLEVRATFQLAGLALVLSAGDQDGFLAELLGGDVTVPIPFAIVWSSRTGLTFAGSAGLAVTAYPHLSVGPIHVDELALALRSTIQHGRPPELSLGAGLGLGGTLGPIEFSVTDVGLRLRVLFTDGNAGPFDLAVGFKAPNGLGLVVDAGPVTGGGALMLDSERGQYAGEVQLQFEGIAARAIGLLTTRLPGGGPGFSLLVLVSTDFPPVQLGLGFMLLGVGGLLGINRTVSVEALRAGLKAGAVGAALSPPDPTADAEQLVASLSGLFPPTAGRHVFAPTARIVWAGLVTIDLALVLELPSPVRLVALGSLRALLPDERDPVVRIQVDVLGVVDFDQKRAAVDATLVDSRLAQFPLTGDLALRMSWGENATFLLAVGGFHPRFAAPAGFPALERVAVALASGDDPKLRLEAYLALTSNTVQFGARVDLVARAGSFSIAGFLSFDALVTLAPLAFVVDIAAKLAVTVGGHTLLSVSLALTLSGPRPWRARGSASFSILFFDVSFSFDVTIGEDVAPVLPAPVDVAPLLLAALADPRAWSAQLPAGAADLVTLRALEPGTSVLAHPLATLQVRQRVAPLERTLERFGSSVPSGAKRFGITLATIGDVRTTLRPLQDRFAPAQFTALSDDEKLSAPSFEDMPAGAALGADGYATGASVTVGVLYEQLVVTAPGVAEPKSERVDIPVDVFATLTATPPVRSPIFAVRDAA